VECEDPERGEQHAGSGIRIYTGVLELQLAGPAHGKPNPVRGGNRCNAAAAGHPTQRGQPRLALDQRQRADIVAVETQKVEDEETNPAALPASDAAWIMPSGKTPYNSPSR
jgi:hypothetical protein